MSAPAPARPPRARARAQQLRTAVPAPYSAGTHVRQSSPGAPQQLSGRRLPLSKAILDPASCALRTAADRAASEGCGSWWDESGLSPTLISHFYRPCADDLAAVRLHVCSGTARILRPAHPCHIALGLRSPLPHLHRDCAHSAARAGTEMTDYSQGRAGPRRASSFAPASGNTRPKACVGHGGHTRQ